MQKRLKWVAAAVAALALAAPLAACQGLSELDVVGRQSISSFSAVLQAMPNEVRADELNAGWALSAPDGTVRFIWSEDYSRAPLHDVMLELNAQPFLDAGLEVAKLPEGYAFYEGGGMDGMGGPMLMVGVKLGEAGKAAKEATALSAYELIVDEYRDAINYHTALDHYGVKLGDGNMFEWAKDMEINGYDSSGQDKDIVFVLNPEPFILAGVAPEKVEGWVYAEVPMEENGKTVQVWKFLKPFNLK